MMQHGPTLNHTFFKSFFAAPTILFARRTKRHQHIIDTCILHFGNNLVRAGCGRQGDYRNVLNTDRHAASHPFWNPGLRKWSPTWLCFLLHCGKSTTPHFYGSDAGTSCGTGPILVSKTSRNPSRFLWTRFESVVVVGGALNFMDLEPGFEDQDLVFFVQRIWNLVWNGSIWLGMRSY